MNSDTVRARMIAAGWTATRMDSLWRQARGTPGRDSLGYFVGSRIAQAYYERAADKRAAVRELLMLRDPERILAESAYNA